MSRGEAADLARFKVQNPLWSVNRSVNRAGPARAGFTARKGAVVVHGQTLIGLSEKIGEAERQQRSES
jgi:hypothetical protein